MPSARLGTLPYTPTPISRDSELFIERDSGGSVFVSERTTTKDLTTLEYQVVSTNQNASDGDAFAVDTSGGSVTITFDASPSDKDKIHILDYTGSFRENNCIMARNGNNIMGLNEDMGINRDYVAITFQYFSSTSDWRMVV